MTNVVFVVSHAALVCAEPAGGGEGDFLKLCLQTDPADCFPFAASSLEREKNHKNPNNGVCPSQLHFTWGERCFSPGEMAQAVTGGRNAVLDG